jgi:cell division septum initiation protein DivIVA
MSDTPVLIAETVKDEAKAKAAFIKHLDDVLTEIAEILPEFNSQKRKVEAMKDKAKGFAKKADITERSVEAPSRVVLRWVAPSENSTKSALLKALKAVVGDEVEAQAFFDKLMAATDSEGKPFLDFKDRSGYYNIGDR